MRLESLYICLKMDYLMIIYEFFVEDLPSANSSNQISEGKNSTKTINSNSNNDVQTQVDMLIINPEILLLENQRQTITNCLVLNVSEKKVSYRRDKSVSVWPYDEYFERGKYHANLR